MSERKTLPKVWDAWRNWLVLGIGIKRWLVVLALGAFLVGMGIGALIIALGQRDVLSSDIYKMITLQFVPVGFRVVIPLAIGIVLIIVSILRIGTNLVAPFKRPDEHVAESLHLHTQRSRGPRIVVIGGGTGMPGLLRGLTKYTNNITAIVTVADDGGSSGRLRRELGVLPPGDFRNNIAALARDEALMTQLLQYRFGGRSDGDLQGHAFGNLLLAALAGITGSFDEALVAAGQVLAIRGRVLPATLSNVTLVAKIKKPSDEIAQRVVGESAIPRVGGAVQMVALEPVDPPAYPPAVRAILQADMVVIGPGSLYTSILPNLLVSGIAQALLHTKAKRVYVCNLATQPGETDNYSVADHVVAIRRHISQESKGKRGCIDIVLANSNLAVPPGTGGGNTVFVEPDGLEDMQMTTMDLVDEKRPWRHDSQKLAKAVINLV